MAKKRFENIEVLIFDLDDTLTDSTEAYDVAFKKVGLSLDHPEYNEARHLTKARLGENHVSSHQRLLYFKAMHEAEGKFSTERLLKLQTRYELALQKNMTDQWRRFKRELLFRKLAKRFPMAMITNETTRAQMIKLHALDPKGKYFKAVVTSEEMGIEKPDPLLFREALKRMSADPKKTLMIGNSWFLDVEPALKLGINGVLTTEFQMPTKKYEHPHFYQISRLDQILDLI